MRVNFIIPYFGSFPNYMQLFLNSCEKNPEFNWTIFTDNTMQYNYPFNVNVVKMSFEEMKNLIKSKFEFQFEIFQPHKLCDLKPMYGYIFEEYISDYDFWGYCDVDLILGDLKKFISDEMFKYEKIFTLGHMTLMKNNHKMNRLFMTPINGCQYYKKVLQSQDNFNFDENFRNNININSICKLENISLWEKSCIADIYTKSSNFRLDNIENIEKNVKNYFVWNDGKVLRSYKTSEGWKLAEYMYIHLQKRKMNVKISDNTNIYKIIPNEFNELEIDVSEMGKKDRLVRCKRVNLQYFRIRSKNLMIKIRQRFS